jgi:hypothetical protein
MTPQRSKKHSNPIPPTIDIPQMRDQNQLRQLPRFLEIRISKMRQRATAIAMIWLVLHFPARKIVRGGEEQVPVFPICRT